MTRKDTDSEGRVVSPSSIQMDEGQRGMSDALIKSTDEGTTAEISHQDVRDFKDLEDRIRGERIEVSPDAIATNSVSVKICA